MHSLSLAIIMPAVCRFLESGKLLCCVRGGRWVILILLTVLSGSSTVALIFGKLSLGIHLLDELGEEGAAGVLRRLAGVPLGVK